MNTEKTLIKEQPESTVSEMVQQLKPLLRGRFHALAAVGSLILTIILCWLSRADIPRFISMLIFGLSMIELYSVSATYHIGRWRPSIERVLHSLDYASIFVLIAGTYTPICFNVLHGWMRITILIVIWSLALIGIGLAIFALHLPRGVMSSLYIAMGWVVALALPAFLAVLPWTFVATLLPGGILYTIGGIIYAMKWPNPFPRVFGFHEIFHLFVIAGSAAFAAAIWIWVLPFHRM